jgi:uncharacterized membrane protein YfcA
MTLEKARFRKKALRFNLGLAVLVWIAWAALGGGAAFAALSANWRVAVTMVFGSLVGGGTSEGGGAIAFPVFTKLLHIPAAIARNFSLAIQTVGMGAASLSILYLRIPIERRALLYAGLPGVIGVALGAYYMAPVFPPALARASFTVLVTSLGVALVLINRSEHESRNERLSIFGAREKWVLAIAGLIGGGVSALVGSGANTVAFMVMVLLFRISEKIVTPTTVLLMAMVSLAGFTFHLAVLQDFGPNGDELLACRSASGGDRCATRRSRLLLYATPRHRASLAVSHRPRVPQHSAPRLDVASNPVLVGHNSGDMCVRQLDDESSDSLPAGEFPGSAR